ncbi:D-alanyl-D-alanine dipeptidase [Paraburkholderia caballeronis]|uniref:D-alanyl-D-alanine dipeptidase n=1 Tax=Paraburkholderia caballeronis TaxID=416943 RepID=UPI0010650BA2|nr:D-alanyl-D-alanine dipeptidase [Paraburkholderia caballeronis]TDV34195.1 D-alanyl-D-alanine dipeptidase [Paraburkholderia caballeronis]
MTDTTHRLLPITASTHDVDIDLVYATDRNLTGKPIYRAAHCLLLDTAEAALRRATAIARDAGLKLRIFDAYRPPQAQQALWNFLPDPTYIADVKIGSNHSRGTAIDLTLLDANGAPLDMGTGFDDMTAASAHFHPGLPHTVQRHRLLLLGIMHAAGFGHIPSEWWHYELPGSHALPLIDDGAAGAPALM